MEIESLSEINQNEWDDFCLRSNSAWFRHTTYWMKYVLHCREDSNSKNISFLVRQNKEIVAIVPLIMQYIYGNEKNNEFANYDTPIPITSIKNDDLNINRKELFKMIQNYIDGLAHKYKISQSKFFIDPLINKNIYDNFDEFNLLSHNYILNSLTTNIIDLSLGVDKVLSQMSKGHKADIKSVYKRNDFLSVVYDKTNIPYFDDSIGIFQHIHFIDAGRKTRSDLSWHDMFNFIRNGYAFLILIFDKIFKKCIAGGFFLSYKSKAYYGSYATMDMDAFDSKIGYIVQWEAIKYMIKNKFTFYETGWNFYSNYLNDMAMDEKLIRISRFKKGFGGKEYPLFNFNKGYYYD